MRKLKIMAAADIYLALTINIYFANCINNNYNLVIPDEDFRWTKYLYWLHRNIHFKQSELSHISISNLAMGDGNLQKIFLSLIPICKRTNLSNFTIPSKSTLLIVMLMCGVAHPHPGPSTVKHTPRFTCSICNKGEKKKNIQM